MDAFRRHGIGFDPELDYQDVRYSFADGYRAVRQLLQKRRRFTAIFAAGDVLAIGAIRALMDHGLKVPEDVSVMGVDGVAMGEFLVPRLSTIRQDVEAMARRSVELLLEAMEKNAPARHENVDFFIEQKESIRSLTEE